MDILALHSNCVPYQITPHPLDTGEIPGGLGKTPATSTLQDVGHKKTFRPCFYQFNCYISQNKVIE